MVKSQVWIIDNKPKGLPKLEDFKQIEQEISPCKDGEFIIEALFFSVDPYIRYRIQNAEEGDVVFGSQVSRVIESCNEDYPVGTNVICYPGWRTHSKVTKADLESVSGSGYRKLPDFPPSVPLSYALGILGMPGNTAYFGFLEICQPKAGETVVVNAAAGAVGSLVCQIAKIKGCTVVAFAGSDDKVQWLKQIGADFSFNYKKVSVSETLKEVAPEGVHCYFDNVGGKFSSEVLPHMAEFGRISICGCIAQYNDESSSPFSSASLSSPYREGIILSKQLKVEGFIVTRWLDRWMEGLSQMKEWLKEGKLNYRETVTNGFENMPKAFIGLFSGDNIGKAIVAI